MKLVAPEASSMHGFRKSQAREHDSVDNEYSSK